MTKELVHYLALIAAAQARVEAMKAENAHKMICDNYVPYGEEMFYAEASLLEEYAMKVINL